MYFLLILLLILLLTLPLILLLILILLRFVAVNLFGYGEVGNIYLEVGRAGTAYRGKYQVNLQWVSPRGGNIRS